MSRSKLLVIAALAVCAFGSVSAANASAASWHVEGAALVGSVNVEEAVTTTSPWVLKTAAVTITCENTALKTAKLTAPNLGSGGGITFTGCKVTSAEASCEIPSEEITTVAVSTETVTGSPVKTTFKPTTGTSFVEITIKSKAGKTCGVAKKAKVSGSAVGETSKTEAETEQAAHLITFTTTSGSSLTFGSEVATLTGAGEVKIEGSKKWSFL
jgi:hypothetical protein